MLFNERRKPILLESSFRWILPMLLVFWTVFLNTATVMVTLACLSGVAYADLEAEVDILDLNLSHVTIKDGTTEYAVYDVVKKSDHDAAGAVAQLQLIYKDSFKLRKAYYLKNLTKLVEMEAFSEEYESDMNQIVSGIDDFRNSVVAETATTGITYTKALIEVLNDTKEGQRWLRKFPLGWSKYARLTWVEKRMKTLAGRLEQIGKVAKGLDVAIDVGVISTQLFLAMELDTGLLLERLDVIEAQFKGMDDKAFDDAIKELRSHLESKNDETYGSLVEAIELRKLDGTLDEYLQKYTDKVISIAVTAATKTLLAGVMSSAKANFVGLIVGIGVDVLLSEFKDRPKDVLDHFTLSTLLAKGYGINPVTGSDVGSTFEQTVYPYEDQLMNAQLRAYLLYMFYQNVAIIMADEGIIDKIAFWDTNIDREFVETQSQVISDSIETEFSQLALATNPNTNIAAVLVLDESGSINSKGFELEQDGFKYALAQISADGSIEVAVIGFGGNATTHSELVPLTPSNQASLAEALSKDKQGGGTATHRAISQATDLLDNSTAITKIIFLATDGAPDSQSATNDAAKATKSKGITLIPVGVGSGVKIEHLEKLSSTGSAPHPQTFEEFGDVIASLVGINVGTAINVVVPDKITDFGSFGMTASVECIGNIKKVQVDNNSDKSVNVKAVKITGEDASSYTVSTIPPVISARSSVLIDVVFAPNLTPADASYDATLTATFEDASGRTMQDSNTLVAKIGESLDLGVYDAWPVISKIELDESLTIDPRETLLGMANLTSDYLGQQVGIAKLSKKIVQLLTTVPWVPVTEEIISTAIEQGIPKMRKGFVADGNARLLLVAKTNVTSGTVKFTIMKDKYSTEALLYSLDNNSNDDTKGEVELEVPITPVPVTGCESAGQATAVLRAPERFFGGTLDEDGFIRVEARSAAFDVEVCIVSTGSNTCKVEPIKEKRTPVILIHGLWANNESWTSEDRRSGMRPSLLRDGYRVDMYEHGLVGDVCNEGPSVTMQPEESSLKERINDSCEREKQEGFACTRADLVGHSMGGLVARKFIHDNLYFATHADYYQGSVRRLITLSTPHHGSPLANTLIYRTSQNPDNCPRPDGKLGYLFGGNKDIDDIIEWLAYKNNCVYDDGRYQGNETPGWGKVCDYPRQRVERYTATLDLAEGSELLEGINSIFGIPVPTFALFGNVGTQFDPALILGATATMTIENNLAGAGCNYDDVIGAGVESDGIVPILSSKADGLIDPENTAPLTDVPHVGMGTDQTVIDEVISLLTAERKEFSAEKRLMARRSQQTIPQAQQEIPTTPTETLQAPRSSTRQSANISLTLEVDNPTPAPGETITFSTTVTGEVDKISSIFLTDRKNTALEDTTAPYEWKVEMLNTFAGIKTFGAIANVDGSPVGSDNLVTITVKPDMTTLQDLIFSPAYPIVLSTGQTHQVTVLGHFDGTNRDITHSTMETVYSEAIVDGSTITPGDSPAVSISTDGLITGLQPGIVDITAINNGKTSILRVTVIYSIDEQSLLEQPELKPIFSLSDKTGPLSNSKAQFYGGISVNDGVFELSNSHVKRSKDTVTISGHIVPEKAHVGHKADIIIVGLYSTQPNDECDPQKGDWYVNTKAENLYCTWIPDDEARWCNDYNPTVRSSTTTDYWQRWDGNLKQLPSIYKVTLSDTVLLTPKEGKVLYKDIPPYAGHVCVNFGYRLHDASCGADEQNCCTQPDKDCTLVFNGQPIQYSVQE